MARCAILRESGGLVRRVGGAVVVAQMAVDTGRAGQVVIVVHVACDALLGGMLPYQREPGSGVIERARGPTERRRSVARDAVLRKATGFVRWIVRAVVIGLVAVPAGRAVEGVVIVDVAGHAGLGGMQSYQREPGGGVGGGGAGPD